MTENMQADDGQNRKAVFVRCCLKQTKFYVTLFNIFWNILRLGT